MSQFIYIVKFMYYKFKFTDGCKALQFAEDMREYFVPDDESDRKSQVTIIIANATTGESVEE